MSGIFISYRRSDAAGYAGRLYDRLASRFGSRRVFIDIDNIEPGDEFTRTIERRIGKADTVLVLIGPGWLDAADDDGRPRLQQAGDYVRLEISTALRLRKTLIPVLLGRATMPGAAQLPADLAELAARHALTCSDERFHDDVDTLIAKLGTRPWWRGGLFGAGKARARRLAGRAPRRWRRAAAVIAIGGAALGALGEFVDALDPLGYPAAPLGFVPARTALPVGAYPRLAGNGLNTAPLRSSSRGKNLDQAEVREIVREYNRTAKRIIDSIGR
jgi:hypothetical protein